MTQEVRVSSINSAARSEVCTGGLTAQDARGVGCDWSEVNKALEMAREEAMRRIQPLEINREWRRQVRWLLVLWVGAFIAAFLFPSLMPFAGLSCVLVICWSLYATPKHQKAVAEYKWKLCQNDPTVIALNAKLQAVVAAGRTEHRLKREKARDDWRKQYAKYQQSPNWKRTRTKVLKAANYVCARCGGMATVVHHKTYTRRMSQGEFGHERFTNLQALCGKCHAEIHGHL